MSRCFFTDHLLWMELLCLLNAAGNMVAKNFNNTDGVIHITDGVDAETVQTTDVERRAWFFGGYGFHQLLIKDSSRATLNVIDLSTTTVIERVDVVHNH